MRIDWSDVGLVAFDLDDTLYPEVDYARSGLRAVAERLDPGLIVRSNWLIEKKFDLSYLARGAYALMTLHRPANVDHPEVLGPLLEFVMHEVCPEMPLLWPLHPRARRQMEEFGLWERLVNVANLILLEPLGYHEMLRLNMTAKVMLTDSGGLQEECCVLGTPCLTLRSNTERPITLKDHGGASVLVGNRVSDLRAAYRSFGNVGRLPSRPALWDGLTAGRIVRKLAECDAQPSPAAVATDTQFCERIRQ